jgi:hypothetical protein
VKSWIALGETRVQQEKWAEPFGARNKTAAE